jgi:hypothetical protein
MKEKVILYKDQSQTKPWENPPLGKEFEIEYVGDKARVTGNVFIRSVTSRLNPLTRMGGISGGGQPNKYFYSLVVNGQRVYFTSTYKIPDIRHK